LEIFCTNCQRPYPEGGVAYKCIHCSGVFSIRNIPHLTPGKFGKSVDNSIWQYKESLGLPSSTPAISLGEGGTPLVMLNVLGKDIYVKMETQNPTGSFKDRGASVLVSFLKSRGVGYAVEDSSGNAGAAFAAYAAKAGMKCKIFVPANTAGPKRRQIEAYGAEIQAVPGPRSNASDAVISEVDQGSVYASHAYFPHVMLGYATIAYELTQQLAGAPGCVFVPVGQGNLLLAIGKGFEMLQQAGVIQKMPVLIGVQARACAPIWAVYRYGASGLSLVSEGETVAEGIRVKNPLRGDELLRFIELYKGMILAIDEEEILVSYSLLAKHGIHVEPTSAVVWAALSKVINQIPEPITLVMTGSGLKYAK
jgi:threonine synthase